MMSRLDYLIEGPIHNFGTIIDRLRIKHTYLNTYKKMGYVYLLFAPRFCIYERFLKNCPERGKGRGEEEAVYSVLKNKKQIAPYGEKLHI